MMDDNIVDNDIDSLEATKLLLLEELERVDERIDETKALLESRRRGFQRVLEILEWWRMLDRNLREGVKNEERKKKI